ncbi:MAG: hypothetical protein WCL18_08900 [bacterium]
MFHKDNCKVEQFKEGTHAYVSNITTPEGEDISAFKFFEKMVDL